MANPIKLAGALASMATLVACSPTSEGGALKQAWNGRYGPSPTISESAAKQSANAQKEIVASFLKVTDTNKDAHPDYFAATLAGYNFVDEQCDAYLQALYVLDRERDSAKTSIDAVGQVTSAILGFIPASKLTMSIVTQAFGLGGQFTDDLFKGYLYGKSPGMISHVVDITRNKYRDETSAAKEDIQNGGVPLAYAHIRGYLKLCLPSTISASIETAISGADATADNSKNSSSPPREKTPSTSPTRGNTNPQQDYRAALPQVRLRLAQ